jgi:YHS domain-containing protein
MAVLASTLVIGQDKKSTAKPPAQATDPVCGMTIDTKDAQTSQYKGKTYYFCSRDDKEKFDKSPDKYAKDTSKK